MVLYTAKDAMANDTRRFMEDNAVHLMNDAIVVLTKMDLVPENQKKRLYEIQQGCCVYSIIRTNPEYMIFLQEKHWNISAGDQTAVSLNTGLNSLSKRSAAYWSSWGKNGVKLCHFGSRL